MNVMTALCKTTMLESVFSTIPLVWELFDVKSGQVVMSVYAELTVENGVVLSKNTALHYVNTTAKEQELEVRLSDQGGALYIECDVRWMAPGIPPHGVATVSLPNPVFQFAED